MTESSSEALKCAGRRSDQGGGCLRGWPSNGRPTAVQLMRCRRCAHPPAADLTLYRAQPLPAHFARVRFGLRCTAHVRKYAPRARRPNARLTNPQIAAVRGIFQGQDTNTTAAVDW
jgi:hypothetical protein